MVGLMMDHEMCHSRELTLVRELALHAFPECGINCVYV